MFVACCIAVLACHAKSDLEPEPPPLPGAHSFPGADSGWVGGSSDYPVLPSVPPNAGTFELRTAPGESGPPNAFYMEAGNFSDDFFLFMKRRVTGLEPGSAYDARFCARFISERIGVYLIGKVGATTVEPAADVVEMNGGPYYWMNIDKGNQSQGGPETILLGRLRTFTDERPVYAKTVCPPESMAVTADQDGGVWIYAGVEATFEVTVWAYWERVDVQFTKR